MSAAERSPSRREACLRVALRAYPAVDRQEYGEDLLDAAFDLATSGSSTAKEVGGLLVGGARARARRGWAGLRAFDRQAAGDSLVEPLTGMCVAFWGAALLARMSGSIGAANGARAGLTVGSLLLLVVLVVLVLAVARRQRALATSAALVLFAQATLSAGWAQWRGGIVTAAPQLHLHVGPWWFGPSLVWSLLPFVALLAACCWAMTPASARLPGLPRGPREWSTVRFVALFSPSALLASLLLFRPSLLLEPGGNETTELPGLLFLMLVVASFWLATSSPPGRDHWSAAAALTGLAAVPSVAYGFAGLLTPTLAGVGAPVIRLGFVLLLSGVLVLCCVTVFLAALSAVGLRTGAGAPPHGAVD